MNGFDAKFDRLAAAAREETAPSIDVTDRVLASLQPQVETPASDRMLWLTALASLAAAVTVMIVANQYGVLTTDPLVELIRTGFPTLQ